MDICKKAYEWALSFDFEPIQIEYAAKLALKMLDDSCKMDNLEREIFLARDRATLYSIPKYAPVVHACRLEVIATMMKIEMKAYKKMVRTELNLL